jgi:hypothetical protein
LLYARDLESVPAVSQNIEEIIYGSALTGK